MVQIILKIANIYCMRDFAISPISFLTKIWNELVERSIDRLIVRTAQPLSNPIHVLM